MSTLEKVFRAVLKLVKSGEFQWACNALDQVLATEGASEKYVELTEAWWRDNFKPKQYSQPNVIWFDSTEERIEALEGAIRLSKVYGPTIEEYFEEETDEPSDMETYAEENKSL